MLAGKGFIQLKGDSPGLDTDELLGFDGMQMSSARFRVLARFLSALRISEVLMLCSWAATAKLDALPKVLGRALSSAIGVVVLRRKNSLHNQKRLLAALEMILCENGISIQVMAS